MIDHIKELNANWVSPPGATISDLLEERGWTQRDLAKRAGSSEKHISQLISGLVPLSEEMAVKLASVLGSTPSFWMARESQYRSLMVQKEYKKKLESWTSWLDELPVKELMQHHHIEPRRLTNSAKPEVVDMLLRFFGCSSPHAWAQQYGARQAAFRITHQSQRQNRGAITAWLRAGEVQVESRALEMPNYDQAAFLEALAEIRTLTVMDVSQFEPKLKDILARAGVALAFIRAFRGTRVSGAARWLSRKRPMIQLSLYGKWSDRFWFTFFHEAAHILLRHDPKAVFLDDGPGGRNNDVQEQEANIWAANWLIPEELAVHLNRYCATERSVKVLAGEIGIHPGIVVGRMQYEGLVPHNRFNRLKERYEIRISDEI